MSGAAAPALRAPQPAAAVAQGLPMPQNFREVVKLFEQKREGILRANLMNDVHLVRFEPGRIEFRPEPTAPRELASRMGQLLAEWTGQRWIVSVSQEPGDPTLVEQDAHNRREAEADAARHPFVQAALAAFPGARIVEVRSTALSNPGEALPAAEGLDGEVPLTDEAPVSDDAPLPDESAYGSDAQPEFD